MGLTVTELHVYLHQAVRIQRLDAEIMQRERSRNGW